MSEELHIKFTDETPPVPQEGGPAVPGAIAPPSTKPVETEQERATKERDARDERDRKAAGSLDGFPSTKASDGLESAAKKLDEAATALNDIASEELPSSGGGIKLPKWLQRIIDKEPDLPEDEPEDPSDKFPWERAGYDDGIPDDDSHLDRLRESGQLPPVAETDELAEAMARSRAEREDRQERKREEKERQDRDAEDRRKREREERERQRQEARDQDAGGDADNPTTSAVDRIHAWFDRHGIESSSRDRHGRRAETDDEQTEGEDAGTGDSIKDHIAHSIAQKVGDGIRGAIGKTKIGRGLMSAASRAGITGGRAAAFFGGSGAAAVGAGGAAAAGGGAAGAAGAAGGAAGGAAAGALTNPIGWVALALAGLGVATYSLIRTLNSQGDELEQYSGAIHSARAQIEATNVGNRVERGQRIGANVAQVEAAQGRFNDALYDLMTEVFDELSKLAPLLEFGIDGATVMVRQMQVLVNLAELAFEASPAGVIGTKKTAGEALGEVKESLVELHKASAELFRSGQASSGTGIDAIFNHNPLPQQPRNNLPNPAPAAPPLIPGGLNPANGGP